MMSHITMDFIDSLKNGLMNIAKIDGESIQKIWDFDLRLQEHMIHKFHNNNMSPFKFCNNLDITHQNLMLSRYGIYLHDRQRKDLIEFFAWIFNCSGTYTHSIICSSIHNEIVFFFDLTNVKQEQILDLYNSDVVDKYNETLEDEMKNKIYDNIKKIIELEISNNENYNTLDIKEKYKSIMKSIRKYANDELK